LLPSINMSILFSTYKPIRLKAFVCEGAFDNLNSAVSFARCSEIYPQKSMFSGKIFSSSSIPVNPVERRLFTVVLINLKQDTDITLVSF